MRGRTNESPLQPESANEALVFLVEYKLQPETGFVGGTTTKAIVGKRLFLYLMTMNSFVPGHVVKMNETLWKCKDGLFAVRSSPFASGGFRPSCPVCLWRKAKGEEPVATLRYSLRATSSATALSRMLS